MFSCYYTFFVARRSRYAESVVALLLKDIQGLLSPSNEGICGWLLRQELIQLCYASTRSLRMDLDRPVFICQYGGPSTMSSIDQSFACRRSLAGLLLPFDFASMMIPRIVFGVYLLSSFLYSCF